MSKEMEYVCPTVMSAVLMRLYELETRQQGAFDPLDLIGWWTQKIEEPKAGDIWMSSRMWRLYARHIHVLIAVNVPYLADAAAYDLGIESSLIPRPKIRKNPNGTISEHWTVEDYGHALPPFGFETWQRPLKLGRIYPCDLDE